MWSDIKAWFKAQGGFSHVVAATYASAIAAYGLVPAFHQLVIDVWAKTPPGVREVGLAAWYTSTHKENP